MRKILAAALAVLLLASVLLVPAMAADPAGPYDQTTSTDVPSLLMTEIVANSRCGIKNSSGAEYDAFEYIEIYNRGDSNINLYALSLLRSSYCKRGGYDKTDAYYATWNTWQTTHTFLQKADIKSGNVRAGHTADARETEAMGTAEISTLTFENNMASNGVLAPHTSAVLFFVSAETISALKTYIEKTLAGNNSNADLARSLFRNYYNVPADVDIYYIWAYSGVTNNGSSDVIARDMFALNDCANNWQGYVYALADSSFDIDSESAITDGGTANAKIKCLMPYGACAKGHTNSVKTTGQSAQYIPASEAPAFWNYRTGYVGTIYDPTKAGTETDFVSSGRVGSFKEMGLAYVQVSNPTPGVMPAYQWASVDPENAPESVKGTDPAWASAAILTYLRARFPDIVDDGELDHDLPEIDPNLRDRDDIEKQFENLNNNKNNKNDKNKNSGLPVGALIGIIAGAVVLVGGGVVLTLILVKKKKSAAALAEVEETPVETEGEATKSTEEAPEQTQEQKEE